MGPNVEVETENGDIRGKIAIIPSLVLSCRRSYKPYGTDEI